MILTNLENTLRIFSFICLFLTMLFYWIKGVFFYTRQTPNLETSMLGASNLLLISILLVRWINSNHFPLSNLYESLIFLSWSLLTFLLILQIQTKDSFLGIILTPIILFITTFATFSLPSEMQKASSLVPALQSNWLMMHVTIMMLSYAALISGSLLSIAFLIFDFIKNKDTSFHSSKEIWRPLASLSKKTKINGSTVSMLEENWEEKEAYPYLGNINYINRIDKLDILSYRTIGIGFPLLTIGILSGAVWANETWGSYWNWDPKETWALITWLIYSIYLHSRIIKGWKGQKPALIASIGFLVVWICYLGVNIFGKGLHSYGWFN